MKNIRYIFIILLSINLNSNSMNICTCGDNFFFPMILNLIGSIHKVNFNEIQQIAVFNLGLTDDQIKELNKIKKVIVCDIEVVHPEMLKHFDIGRTDKRLVRGWYSFKPVVIKQALDMFPQILYCDAASVIIGKMDNLYNHIKQQGYALITCNHSIEWMTPRHVIDKFNLNSKEKNWILKSNGMNSGFMGLTRQYYNSYVLPLYDLAHDMKNFIDDGTTPCGFIGHGRHDQTLFSVMARLQNLYIHQYGEAPLNLERILRCHAYENEFNKMKEYIQYK